MALETADLEGDIPCHSRRQATPFILTQSTRGNVQLLRYVCLEDPDGAVMRLVELNLSH